MRVSVILDHRFVRTADGAVWTSTCFPLSHWERYLTVFDEVQVIARVREVRQRLPGLLRADGPGIRFADIPDYCGPVQYVRRLDGLRHALAASIWPHEALILRVPSPLTMLVWPKMVLAKRPYGVEVVGDPYAVFSPGAVQHPLRALFRQLFFNLQRLQCARAAAATYVTTQALQCRYPAGASTPSFSYSDVQLPQPAFAGSPRLCAARRSAFTILCVGSLAQLYKGPDILIDAAADCVRRGFDVRLALVGEGRHRAELEQRADRLGIQRRVRFLGELPSGGAVRAQMDAADLFVLPSRTEGLPRAMIEAMARALPCIGTAVGGIPELLATEDLVPPGQASALADKIIEVLSNPSRMSGMSERNWRRAHDYDERQQDPARRAFYQNVRRLMEGWIERRGPCGFAERVINSDVVSE